MEDMHGDPSRGESVYLCRLWACPVLSDTFVVTDAATIKLSFWLIIFGAPAEKLFMSLSWAVPGPASLWWVGIRVLNWWSPGSLKANINIRIPSLQTGVTMDTCCVCARCHFTDCVPWCFSGIWTRWPFWADGQSWRVDETAQRHHQLRLLISDPPPTFSPGPLWNLTFPSLHVTRCPLAEANVAPLCVWRHLCEVRLLLVLCWVCSIFRQRPLWWKQDGVNAAAAAQHQLHKLC